MGPTVGASVEKYVAGRLARGEIREESARVIREALVPFAHHVGWNRQLDTITKRDLESWATSQTCSPATKRNRISAVKVFWKRCVINDLVRRDPSIALDAPKKPRSVPRCLSAEQEHAVRLAVHDERELLVVTLMIEEGMRRGEVSRVELADIDFGNAVLLVKGKGGHERSLPLTPEAERVANLYLAGRGHRSGRLIRNDGSRHVLGHDGVEPPTIGLIARDVLRRAGIEDGSHCLRHTFARRFLDAGGSIRELQIALGHVSITTTQIYTPWIEVAGLRRIMCPEPEPPDFPVAA